MHMLNEAVSCDLQPLIELRMYGYGILSRTFLREPNRSFFKTLQADQCLELFPFQDEHPLIKQGIALAARSLADLDLVRYEKICWDYTRLFIGPHKIPAPPWESVYLGEERLIFQEVTLNVRQTYLKYGIAPRHLGQEADDHLGYELDFMYQLCQLSLENTERVRSIIKDQKDFLENHIFKWVPLICRDILVHAETDFYKGMSLCLEGFIEIDRKAVNELLDQINGS
ncbi:molecular chaperone TorD family protein [Desulfitobacterium sp.]|uniref:TorD/DmsD family molecular chaperone n=1 Tax=Desulfitobacterium sp. TaxID=49981 RepID=UPI002B2114F0|nr:molecular chaperone TorD family protein [Desulfitobacterium sp.]MEA4900728.1 molecular chaperone TorD family protein [Desulfitobacterium sp.]